MKKKVRILVADDHDIVRRGIRPLIEAEWGWEICGEARDGREAVDLAEKLKPDVVVLDVAMPEINGVDVARQIKQLRPETEVLAFTGTESEELIHQLFAAGVLGVVLKGDAAEQLIPAIQSLVAHQPHFVSRIAQLVFRSYLKGGVASEHSAPGGLSLREREIVQLLGEGKSNKEVAQILGLSVKTAETHRATIMRKLGFTAFSELVRYAVRNHIVKP